MPQRILLAAVSGLALALAFEPYAVPWVIPFCIAGFALATRGLRARSAWLPGLAFGVGFYFFLTVWMRTVGTDAWLGMSSFMSLFYAVLGIVSASLQRRRAWPLLLAAAWVSCEILRSTWPFSGMPWGNLAFGVVDTPMAHLLPYVGAVGLSLLLALLGTCLAWLVVAGSGRRLVAGGVVAVLAALLTLPALSTWDPRTEGEVSIAAVQGDVPGSGDDILYDYRQVTRNHVQATIDLARRVDAGEAQRPDLVVWPENSTATDPFSDVETRTGIESASAAVNTPILVGAIVDGTPGHVLNQGIVWDPVTGAGDRYTKRHPVVFGEYIPFRRYLARLQIGRLTMVGRDMQKGTRTSPLDIDGLLVGDAICFDVAYDDVMRDSVRQGAQVLTVQTSNATFIHTDQIEQQFAITRLRAIETGRWIVVASPNGISGIIGPDGTVVTQAEPRTTDVLQADVGLSSRITPAVRMGPWPGRAILLVTLVGLLAGRLPYRQRGGTPGVEDDAEEARVGGPASVLP